MKIPLYQIDAFADQPFKGNPAAVCPLDEWLDDETMQAMALENNLSETAFFVGGGGKYDLRWFTPGKEVDLCGHATLASAHVVFNRLEPSCEAITFSTRSGDLHIKKRNGLIEMDFPASPPAPVEPEAALLPALGGSPTEVLAAYQYYLVIYETAADVAALTPDFTALGNLDKWGVVVSAPGDGEVDCASRFFAPAAGVPEDPVTGSAHCIVVPYWAERLGKKDILAHQISSRGGVLHCRDEGDRVTLAGNAVEVLTGEFLL